MAANETKLTTPRPPMDGASKVARPKASSRDGAPAKRLTLQRGEPADAFVTGGTRSLQRRVLGLNIPLPTREVAVKPEKKVVKGKTAGAR